MPEMFEFCGRRFRVYRRAEKTCDTIMECRSRRMRDTVHLEGVRCDGDAHGGCEAGCLIFWKEAWLRPVGESCQRPIDAPPPLCTEETVARATRAASAADGPERFACQATDLLQATSALPWWDIRQYARELRCGNVAAPRMGTVLVRAAVHALRRRLPSVPLGGIRRTLKGRTLKGRTPKERTPKERTPIVRLDLHPGELVQVKSREEIALTLDTQGRNRGLFFDVEMLPYCGRTFRVLRRVQRIIDERTGRMLHLPNDCIVLEGVVCSGERSRRRLFCPRSIVPYWREIWLRRVALPQDEARGIPSSLPVTAASGRTPLGSP
jgi:hypothetical protein